MSQPTQRSEIALKTAVYRIPGMETVETRKDVVYQAAETGPLTMDLYYPTGKTQAAPAVIIVAGYPDPGFERVFGCKFKEMGSSVSWAQLLAASGIVAVAYSNREPAANLAHLLDHLRQNAATLGIDRSRIALFASSGNVPLALSALIQSDWRDSLKCAALCYGLTLDLDGGTEVADAAKTWGFANPNAGKSVRDLPPSLPLFVARAGQDNIAGLNVAMDRFLSHAVSANLPLTFANHPDGPHGFDLMHASETSREIIRQILRFLQVHLGAA